jgi:anthranilate phosphoribosyltransferase
MTRFDAAPFIKDIGRGSQHPTDLNFERASELWQAVLEDRLDPVALGAVLLAFRVKGETATEVAAFLSATERSATDLTALSHWPMPVVIPSYNGARKMPNLTPLLALLLAREGVPVLVHGGLGGDIPAGRPQRVTSAALFAALDLPALEKDAIAARWNAGEPVFMTIESLNPALARILALRAVLGVRNSAHTLAKLLQPFSQPALCLSSFTHPEYLVMLTELLGREDLLARQDSVLLRGTEGEAVANARRAVPMYCFSRQAALTLEPEELAGGANADIPQDCSIAATTSYISQVLAGTRPVPAPIAWQVSVITRMRTSALAQVHLA